MINENRKAVIIGINRYDDEAISQLSGAENDAVELHGKLSDPGTCNFKIRKEHYLLGSNATCKNIRQAISDIFWQSFPCDLALFYFSGHGFSDSYGNGYIAPFDIKKNEPLVSGIKMKELTDVISNSVGKKSAVMILDCCYSGLAARGTNLQEFNTQVNLENYQVTQTGEGRITLTSSSDDALAREEETTHIDEGKSHAHGIFTSCLIDGLEGRAAMNDEAGIINVDNLRRYIDLQMQKKGKQTPYYSVAQGSRTDNIILSIASEKHLAYKNRILDEIDNICNSKSHDLNNLLKAASSMEKLLSFGPPSDVITAKSILIEECLEQCREPIREWLLRYQTELENDLNQVSDNLYSRLITDLVDSLTLEKIYEIDEKDFKLLIFLHLCAKEQVTNFVNFKKNFTTKYRILWKPNPVSNKLNQQTTISIKGL